MASDDFLSIVNASSSAMSPAVGRRAALATAFLSPTSGGEVAEDSSSASLVSPVQWGPSLVLIRDHTKVCGGQFGVKKNNCFCCMVLPQNKDCPSRHALVKHALSEDAVWVHAVRLYFHKGSNSGAVYAAPFVDVKDWTEEAIGTLLSKSFGSWQQWSDEVVVIQAAKDSKQDAENIRTAVKLAKTLPRLKANATDQGLKLSFQEDTFLANSTGDTVLEETDLGQVQKLKKEPELVTWEAFGPDTIGRINLLQETVIGLGDATSSKLRELQVGLAVRLTSLETQLGACSESEVGKQLEGASVWGTLEDIQSQVNEFKGAEYVRELGEKVLTSVGFLSHTEKVKDAFQVVMQRLLPLEKRLEDLATTGTVGVNQGWDWLGGSANMNQGKSEELEAKVHSLAGRMDNLELTMVPTTKSEGEDVMVSFMGIRFTSEEDVRLYVESINGGKFDITPGLVTDCYAIFHALNREIFDAKSKLNMVDLAKVSNLGAKQADVYHLLAAAEHGLPEFFDSPTSSGKFFIDGKHGKKHRFNNIASYEVWGPVGTIKDAVRKRAEVQLTRFVKTKRLAIQEVSNPELCTFLTAMLNASKEFVEAVFSFMTEEYSALAEHFNDGTLCWDFACSCIEHVFKYEFEVARAVITNPDVGDTSINPKVLWQALRTITVQESFMRVGFKNHSSLASAYSRFLLTQYQQTALELAKVSKEAEVYKSKLVDVVGTVEALDKRVRAAEGTANAAKNAMERLSKRDGRNGAT
jgi:hypothetical protein